MREVLEADRGVVKWIPGRVTTDVTIVQDSITIMESTALQ
jgi:hypothetical protein